MKVNFCLAVYILQPTPSGNVELKGSHGRPVYAAVTRTMRIPPCLLIKLSFGQVVAYFSEKLMTPGELLYSQLLIKAMKDTLRVLTCK